MKLSRKTLVKGKRAFLKECSQEYWGLLFEEFYFNELGNEWMWE